VHVLERTGEGYEAKSRQSPMVSVVRGEGEVAGAVAGEGEGALSHVVFGIQAFSFRIHGASATLASTTGGFKGQSPTSRPPPYVGLGYGKRRSDGLGLGVKG